MVFPFLPPSSRNLTSYIQTSRGESEYDYMMMIRSTYLLSDCGQDPSPICIGRDLAEAEVGSSESAKEQHRVGEMDEALRGVMVTRH